MPQCSKCSTPIECPYHCPPGCSCLPPGTSSLALAHCERSQYRSLCAACAASIEELVQRAQGLSFPQRPSEVEEGTHYYIDQGRWVFTELYLYLRGYCCQNGCRHCPYGF